MCGSVGLGLGRRRELGPVCERERKGEKKRRGMGIAPRKERSKIRVRP